MKQKEIIGYSMAYVNNARKNNIIYPDHHNESDEGLRANYFYLHNKAEGLAGFDCFNVSPKLLVRLLENTVQIATMTINGKSYELLVFCQFKKNYGRMKGYAVLIDDIEGVNDAIRQYPRAFRQSKGHTPDAYLENEHPEVYKLLVQSAYNRD